jgi:hypothetical protein
MLNPDENFAKNLEDQVKKSGVKVIEGYFDGPGHHFYYVVEAENATQILQFSATTLIPIGETKVAPVLKWSEAASAVGRMEVFK